MDKYDWHVVYLKELSVNQTDKLGWNVNSGEMSCQMRRARSHIPLGLEISLRVRVDKDNIMAFRDYEEIRDVMLHEMTHNVFGPHDNNFHNFNRILHQELAEFEARELRYNRPEYGELLKETEKRSGLKLGMLYCVALHKS